MVTFKLYTWIFLQTIPGKHSQALLRWQSPASCSGEGWKLPVLPKSLNSFSGWSTGASVVRSGFLVCTISEFFSLDLVLVLLFPVLRNVGKCVQSSFLCAVVSFHWISSDDWGNTQKKSIYSNKNLLLEEKLFF